MVNEHRTQPTQIRTGGMGSGSTSRRPAPTDGAARRPPGTTMTQTPAILSAAEPIPADAFVLEGHELRDGVELADTSRFGDDIWHLHPINHQDHLNRNILSFPTLPDEFRAVTKELF